MPEIDDCSVFAKTTCIGRKTGGSKPYTGIQNITDPGGTFGFDKVLAAVFIRKLLAKNGIIDDKTGCDLRVILFYIFKKITGILVIMQVIRRGKNPDIWIRFLFCKVLQKFCKHETSDFTQVNASFLNEKCVCSLQSVLRSELQMQH